MVLGAVSSGLPAYALQMTDSSLFIFTNINVDTGEAGSASSDNVYVAGVAINSAPDDLSSKAFAPTPFVLGLVRQAQVGTATKFVFIPETDSVVIGGKRYMLSIIELDTLTDDPTKRPYPPNFWPDSQWWQFANRHDPYLDIRYQGNAESDRITSAQTNTQTIAQTMQQAQEPLQMYLDTQGMVVWPILGFPFDTASQSVDRNQLADLQQSGILDLLAAPVPAAAAAGQGVSASEQVVLPGSVSQQNPYTYGVDFAQANAAVAPSSGGVSASSATAANEARRHRRQEPHPYGHQHRLQPQQGAPPLHPADAANRSQSRPGKTDRSADRHRAGAGLRHQRHNRSPEFYEPAEKAAARLRLLRLQRHLWRVLPHRSWSRTDLTIPNQFPDPTLDATYDPYYVRVVFLGRRKAYNMSIIVPRRSPMTSMDISPSRTKSSPTPTSWRRPMISPSATWVRSMTTATVSTI